MDTRVVKRVTGRLRQSKGALSIEATLTFPLLMMGLLLLILLLRDIGQKDRIEMDLIDVSQHLSRIEIDSTIELAGFSLATLPLINLGDQQTLVPYYPKLYPDGRYEVSYLWTRSFPIVGKKSQTVKMVGRSLQLGNRDIGKDHSETVYVTNTGKKYHKPDCMYLKDSKRAMDKKEALEAKYEPCLICIGGLELFEKAPGGGK